MTVGATLFQAALSTSKARFTSPRRTWHKRTKLLILTSCLHLAQPVARLWGRLSYGLSPWRHSGEGRVVFPGPRTATVWNENWKAPHEWIQEIQKGMQGERFVVLSGGDYDRWDLEVRGGTLGAVRLFLSIEEHGANRQLIRLRLWPKISWMSLVFLGLLIVLSIWAGANLAWVAHVVLGVSALVLALRIVEECGTPMAALLRALKR